MNKVGTIKKFFIQALLCGVLGCIAGACNKAQDAPGYTAQIVSDAEKTRQFLRQIDSLLSDIAQERSTTNTISQTAIKDKINRIKWLQDSIKSSIAGLQQGGGSIDVSNFQTQIDTRKKEIEQLSQQLQVADKEAYNLYNTPALCIVGTYKKLKQMNVVEYIESKELPISGPEPEDYFQVIQVRDLNRKEIDLQFHLSPIF